MYVNQFLMGVICTILVEVVVLGVAVVISVKNDKQKENGGK